MNAIDFIIKTAQTGLSLQTKNGSMPCGNNGPYLEKETSVRNTSHWLIIFSKVYELTGDENFKYAIKRAAEFLISDQSRPSNASFWHRDQPGVDKSNGIIGAAWSIEALCEASITLKENKYAKVAEEVFFMHKFNNTLGVWNRLEIDGKIGRIDQTFNHQLWFAACSSLLLNNNFSNRANVEKRIKIFMSKITQNLFTYENGLIHHSIIRKIDLRSILSETATKIKEVIEVLFLNSKLKENKLQTQIDIYWKSIGYQSFNLYGFALLKSNIQEHELWNSNLIKQSTEFIMSSEFFKLLDIENYYGFPYNPPGFEIPFYLNSLSDLTQKEIIKLSEFWINEQINRHYGFKDEVISINNKDKNTLTARIYELCRINNSILENIELKK